MNKFPTALFAFIASSIVRRLICMVALFHVLVPATSFADVYYKMTEPNGVSASETTTGIALPFPLSTSDGAEFCRSAGAVVYADQVEEQTTFTYPGGTPGARITCSASWNPVDYRRTIERILVSRCPSATRAYAGYGYGSPGGQFEYAFWGWENDFGTNAYWCSAPCKKGEISIWGTCVRDKNIGETCSTKNPISIAEGNKFLREIDYVGSGPFPLTFTRYYNSRQASADYSSSYSHSWRHEYQRRFEAYTTRAGVSEFSVERPNGRTSIFQQVGTDIVPMYADTKDVLERLTDAGGAAIGWRFKSFSSDEVEIYDIRGYLLSITNRAGATLNMTYSSGPSSVAPRAGVLIRVTDPVGRSLQLTYDPLLRLTSMTDPAGGVYTYSYDGVGIPMMMSAVTYPDTRTRIYRYNEPGQVVNGAYGLTGITGEDGLPFVTYQYNWEGRAMAEQVGGIADQTTLVFGTNSTTVTDALNTPRTYTFQDILGVKRLTGQSQPGGAGCGPASQGIGYDANGNISSTTDFNGQQSTYTHDLSRNLETSRTEAAGTPKARTITTQWHPMYRLPTQIDEPGRRTTYMHDPAGNVLTHTVLDTTTSVARTTTYSYNTIGQVLTVNGPRADVNDVTTYSYYECTTGYECGQVHTIRDALDHTTTFNSYNAHGQLLTITDANGVVTTLTYDERRRIRSRAVAGEVTAFFYYPTGLLQQVVMPDGGFLNYVYDPAHRLTEINDSQGNRIVYTLDAMGNRTAENVYDPSSALARTRSRVFDGLGRLWKDLTAAGTEAQTTIFGYDANGNQTTVNAPMGRNGINGYDELNRLATVTDANNGLTQYVYNALDQLTSVTDPRNLQTTYNYNGLGDLLTQVSPDTGTTVNTYDSGGNLKTTTDSRNKTATYTYDALNRVTQVVYPDQTVTYVYDSGPNAIGRLSSVTDSSGTTLWSYTAQGRIATKTQIMGTMVKTVQYGYNAAGQLTTITTPSNKTITYGYTNDQVTHMMVNSVNLLHTVLYEPFGPTSGWTWGNGTLAVRTYDTDGKLTQLDSAGFKTIGYDDAFRITSVTDQVNSANSWSYGYDTLDRLTSGISASNTQSFSFDANGNRLTQGGTNSSTFTVSPTNNRLSGVSGALSKSYQYDNAGNTTSDETATYAYNDAGRMTSVTKAGVTTSYTYNALGQRVTKTTAGNTTYFVYDESGHLLGEYDSTGELISETAWMYDTPVASIRFGSCGLAVFYIHTDHLNTPRRITKRSSNEIIWRWDSDAFGTTMANENPSGLGTFVFNLRFPGQYFDAETGLVYNWFRYYDPQSGRYVTSDPIGLAGGTNTYAYVGGNPISRIDPLGLIALCEKLRKLRERTVQTRGIQMERVLARIPWMQGHPTGLSDYPSSDPGEWPTPGGTPGRRPVLPKPEIEWAVQFGWREKQEFAEYIVWQQFNLWLLKCEETTCDESGKSSTRYWLDEKEFEASTTRDRGHIWTEWNFVPTSATYTMSIPGL